MPTGHAKVKKGTPLVFYMAIPCHTIESVGHTERVIWTTNEWTSNSGSGLIVNYYGSIGREMTFPHRSAYSSIEILKFFFFNKSALIMTKCPWLKISTLFIMSTFREALVII